MGRTSCSRTVFFSGGRMRWWSEDKLAPCPTPRGFFMAIPSVLLYLPQHTLCNSYEKGVFLSEEHQEVRKKRQDLFSHLLLPCQCWHFSFSLFCNNVFSLCQDLLYSYLVSVYKKSLGDDISSETSGDFRKALLTLADVSFYFLLLSRPVSCMLKDHF